MVFLLSLSEPKHAVPVSIQLGSERSWTALSLTQRCPGQSMDVTALEVKCQTFSKKHLVCQVKMSLRKVSVNKGLNHMSQSV